MASSKPSSTVWGENTVEKINKMQVKDYNGDLNTEEIMTFCYIDKIKPVSIELIRNLLGGPNMEYPVIDIGNSFDCYDFCRQHMIKQLQETEYNIEFFEDRMTSDSNVIVAVVKKPKKGGNGEQIMLWSVIRMTLFNPKSWLRTLFQLDS